MSWGRPLVAPLSQDNVVSIDGDVWTTERRYCHRRLAGAFDQPGQPLVLGGEGLPDGSDPLEDFHAPAPEFVARWLAVFGCPTEGLSSRRCRFGFGSYHR